MSLQRLVRAIPPPAAPLEAFAGPWEPVEARLGMALPQDYKDLARLYGRGRFMEFLVVNLPGDPDRRGSLEGELQLSGEMINLGVPVRYPVWPEPGGLLNFGLTDFNDRLFWLPQGEPSDWKIVVWDRVCGNFETFGCSLTDFLAGLAAGTINPEGFASNQPARRPVFDPGLGVGGSTLEDAPAPLLQSRTTRRGIEALIQAAPPPSEPFRPFSGPWHSFEVYLGTALPQDYKDFARLYGSGLFLDLLTVYVPEIADGRLSFKPPVGEARHHFMPDDELPYRFWPSVGGLIRFGSTDTGDQLYWLARGPPDGWKVVFWDRGAPEFEAFEEFDCGMAEFLAGLVSGTLVPRGYKPDGLEIYEPLFLPYAERLGD